MEFHLTLPSTLNGVGGLNTPLFFFFKGNNANSYSYIFVYNAYSIKQRIAVNNVLNNSESNA